MAVTDFQIRCDRFGELIKSRAALVVKKVTFDLLDGVILMTPVDTGRARGSWEVALGGGGVGEPGRLDKIGGAAMGAGVIKMTNYKLGDGPILIGSNLNYIKYLEEGSSDQAPYGMVAVTAARFDNIVRKVVSEVKS